MWTRDSIERGRYFSTPNYTGNQLYAYNRLAQFKSDQPSAIFDLDWPYYGTGGLVFNGSFYYHRAGFNEIVRVDLANDGVEGDDDDDTGVKNMTVAAVQSLPDAVFQVSQSVISVCCVRCDDEKQSTAPLVIRWNAIASRYVNFAL